jgi:hypothetical protein
MFVKSSKELAVVKWIFSPAILTDFASAQGFLRKEDAYEKIFWVFWVIVGIFG